MAAVIFTLLVADYLILYIRYAIISRCFDAIEIESHVIRCSVNSAAAVVYCIAVFTHDYLRHDSYAATPPCHTDDDSCRAPMPRLLRR